MANLCLSIHLHFSISWVTLFLTHSLTHWLTNSQTLPSWCHVIAIRKHWTSLNSILALPFLLTHTLLSPHLLIPPRHPTQALSTCHDKRYQSLQSFTLLAFKLCNPFWTLPPLFPSLPDISILQFLVSYVTKVDDSNPRKFGDIEFTEQQMEEYKEAFLGTGCSWNIVFFRISKNILWTLNEWWMYWKITKFKWKNTIYYEQIWLKPFVC